MKHLEYLDDLLEDRFLRTFRYLLPFRYELFFFFDTRKENHSSSTVDQARNTAHKFLLVHFKLFCRWQNQDISPLNLLGYEISSFVEELRAAKARLAMIFLSL